MHIVEFSQQGVEGPLPGVHISRVSLHMMLHRYLLKEAELPTGEPLHIQSLGCGLNGGIEGAVLRRMLPLATYIGYDNDNDEVCLAQDLLNEYLLPEEQEGITIQKKDICSYAAAPASLDVLLIRNPSPNGYIQSEKIIETWTQSVKPGRFILATYEIPCTSGKDRRGVEIERMRSAFGRLIENGVLRVIADEENPSPHPIASFLRSDRGILLLQRVG